MGFDAHKNMAVSTVATAPSPATSGTSLVVAAGEGARFPAAPFNATVWPANTAPTPANSEIVRVTARSTDTLTIDRAQETGAGGPSARSIIVGDQIAATITAKTLTDIEGHAKPTPQTTSATGTQNNFDLNARFTHLLCSGAAVEFTGFTVMGAAPQAGDVVIIENVGTSTETTAVTHEATSTAANQITCPSTTGQIVGSKGRMQLIYNGTTSKWLEQCIEPGAPITPTFAAGDFTGNGSMTWTVDSGDVTARQYKQRGRTVYANLDIRTSSVGGTPSTQLTIACPRSWSATKTSHGVGIMSDNGGTLASTWMFASAGITFFKDFTAGTNWTASTNATRVSGAIQFEID